MDADAPKSDSPPRVGIWGTFDVANYGDLLFPLIFEQELGRRIPDVLVEPYAPLGTPAAPPILGATGVLPLGHWTDERRRWLAERLDAVVVGGGEIIHTRLEELYETYLGVPRAEVERMRPSGFLVDGLGPELERACPVAWNCVGVPFDFSPEEAQRVRLALDSKRYVAVRDEPSRWRLLATGSANDVHVVADSALVLPRLLSREALAARVERLRAAERYPGTPPLVVQGSRALLPYAGELAAVLAGAVRRSPGLKIVLLEIGPIQGDGEFADVLAELLAPVRPTVLRRCALADIAAAIAFARCFAGVSLHGAITAYAYDVPAVILNLIGYGKLAAFAHVSRQPQVHVSRFADLAETLSRGLGSGWSPALEARRAELIEGIDRHFDAIADLVRTSWRTRRDRMAPCRIRPSTAATAP